MKSADRPRPSRAVVAMLTSVGVAMASSSLWNPFAFVPDDSLFYVVIGRNIADGSGITFNRVMPTNGFQPLWQAVVAVVVAVTQGLGVESAAGQLRAVIVACWVVLVAGLLVFDRALFRVGLGARGRFGGVAAVLFVLGGGYGTLATEANLVFCALAVALLIGLYVVDRSASTRLDVVFGVSLGVVLLARLDSIFVVTCIVIMVMVRLGVHEGWGVATRRAARFSLGAGVILLPYLAWNLVEFGNLLPISGAIKLDFRSVWLVAASVGRDGWLLLIGAAITGAAASWRTPVSSAAGLWGVVLAGALSSSVFYYLFSPGKLTSSGWYHAPHIMALGLGVALLTNRVANSSRAGSTAIALLLSIALVGMVVFDVRNRVRGPNDRQAVAVVGFAERVALTVPPGAVVATVDYPGYMALVTTRPVVALDGLTGDFVFQDRLRDLGARCTLNRLGVRFLVTKTTGPVAMSSRGSGVVTQKVGSWMYNEPAGELMLLPTDRVFADRRSGLVLWRFQGGCD